MPTNLGHEAISALKVGHSSATAAYVGHQQIFPNTTEIQSAAFTSTAGMSNVGGSRIFRVTGEVGASYNLTGYGAGSYTITSSPYDHTINVGLNNDCTDPNRTITTTLTPTGNTILQGGGSSFTSSFTQSGGPGINTYNANPSITVTNTNYATTTINGTLKWAPGAAWDVSWSYNGTYATHSTSGMSIGVSGSTRTGDYTGSGSSDSGTYNFTLGSGVSGLSSVRFYLIVYSSGCNEANDGSSGYIYP